MRVLHVIKATGIAGAEKHILILLDGLRRLGADAHLVVLVEPRNPVRSLIEAARRRRIPARGVRILSDLDPTLLPRLRRIMRRLGPEIVHTHLVHGDVYGLPAAVWAGVPVRLTTRHAPDPFRLRAPLRQVNQRLWSLVRAGIAVSRAVARHLIHVEEVPESLIRVIQHGLEPEDHTGDREAIRAALGIDPGGPIVGMAGRLIPSKGMAHGLEAFAMAHALHPRCRLLLAGEGPERAALEREARRLGVADSAHFLGWRDDLPRFMAALDVFLMPSLTEGFGIAILEAMAQAVPVIATAAGGAPEVIREGDCGFLTPPGDADAMAARLGLILHDSDLRRRLGREGRTRVQSEFSAERMARETLSLYRELLEARGRVGPGPPP